MTAPGALPADAEIHDDGDPASMTADALGRFAAGGLAPGPMHRRLRPLAPGPPVVTDWFTA